MSLDIKIDADEVTKALDELDGKQTSGAIKKAVGAAGKFLKPKVKAEAPKGPTGNLRKKVGSRVKKGRRSGDYFAVVRSFARHHHLVVQGTGNRFTSNGAFRGRMPSNPYVDRAADRWENAAIDVAEQELVRQLDLD